MQENDNFTALQSMQGILHITALQPCEFLPLLKFLHSAVVAALDRNYSSRILFKFQINPLIISSVHGKMS